MKTKYTWAREGGYELSSKGDQRFSAFFAKMPDGNTLEHWYQCYVKGYSSIKEGKSKPPKMPLSREATWNAYYSLWVIWLNHGNNKNLLADLYQKTKHTNRVLTDMFAATEINQARAIAELLNTFDE